MRPTEQDEFFLHPHELLGLLALISSEWVGDTGGRTDFHLPGINWGLEVLPEGDWTAGHCRRSVNNGSYTLWIQKRWLRDWVWVTVDCALQSLGPRVFSPLLFSLYRCWCRYRRSWHKTRRAFSLRRLYSLFTAASHCCHDSSTMRRR